MITPICFDLDITHAVIGMSESYIAYLDWYYIAYISITGDLYNTRVWASRENGCKIKLNKGE